MKKLLLIIVAFVYSQAVAQDRPLKIPEDLKIKSIVSELEVGDFHNYHVREFAKADGFAMERTISMPKIVHLIVDGKKYKMTNMRLLSVTDRKKPVMWELPAKENYLGWLSDGIDRSMLKNKDMKKRPLTKEELMSMNSLRQGKERVLTSKAGAVHLMAPLHAGPSCIKCHEDYKKDEFMGAFLYDLRVVEGGLNKKEEKPQSEKEKEPEQPVKEVSSK